MVNVLSSGYLMYGVLRTAIDKFDMGRGGQYSDNRSQRPGVLSEIAKYHKLSKIMKNKWWGYTRWGI